MQVWDFDILIVSTELEFAPGVGVIDTPVNRTHNSRKVEVYSLCALYLSLREYKDLYCFMCL